jgi:hypothetical protein
MYRYDLPGGRRRVRPPRSRTYCKTCQTLIRAKPPNASGSCDSCALQLPLFTLPGESKEVHTIHIIDNEEQHQW